MSDGNTTRGSANSVSTEESSRTDQPYGGERDVAERGEKGMGVDVQGDGSRNVGAVSEPSQRQDGLSDAEKQDAEDEMPDAEDEYQDAEDEKQDTEDNEYDRTMLDFWSMYLSESKEEDTTLVDNMTAHTNGVLVFTGLFGAIVTTFIIESYKQLQPDSGNATVALLAQISQQIAASSNGAHLPVPPPITLDSSSFHPSSSALRVNILWFLSLALSLSCALAATLMQQWARRYISNTQGAQRAGTAQNEGLIHAYLFIGLYTFRFKTAVEALPALLHASVVLFFVGLIDFLFSINNAVAYVLLGFVVLGALIYLGLTMLPILYPNCPYATPLFPVMAYLVSFLAAIPRALIRLAVAGFRSPMCTTLWADKAEWTLGSLEVKIRIWRSSLTGSTRNKLDYAARSHCDQVEPNILVWTLVTVMDDNAKLAKCVRFIHLFLQRKEQIFAKFVSHYQHMDMRGRRPSDLQRREHEIAEVLTQLRTTVGLRSRIASVFSEVAASLKALNPVEAAASREWAMSCLHLMRMLQNDRMPLGRAFGMRTALSALRQDADTDLSLSASCTSALFHFHHHWEGLFAGPVDDIHCSETDLELATKALSINSVDDWDVSAAFAFVSFTQSVLPRIKTASPAIAKLVWKTFGYDTDTRFTPNATSTRNFSWDSMDRFPVGGEFNLRWRRRTSSDHRMRRDQPKALAKLMVGLRRLRATIHSAEGSDVPDGDLPVGSVLEPSEMYTRLYNSLRPLYRFLAECEAQEHAPAVLSIDHASQSSASLSETS